MKRFIRLAMTTVVVLVGAACDDPLTVEELPGSYVATTLTVTQDGSDPEPPWSGHGASMVSAFPWTTRPTPSSGT